MNSYNIQRAAWNSKNKDRKPMTKGETPKPDGKLKAEITKAFMDSSSIDTERYASHNDDYSLAKSFA